MKKISLLIISIISIATSCTKKDAREIPDLPQYHSPVADAGRDQTIFLEYTNSGTLDGSGSKDFEDTIKAYLWTKLSGPSSCRIVQPNDKKTLLTDLTEGIYEFELKVTDERGISSKDITLVDVKNLSSSAGCFIPGATQAGSFHEAINQPATVVCNGKIYFAAGYAMYIFDPVSNSTTIENKIIERAEIGAVSAGNRIFFAGGYKYSSSGAVPSSKVDIYDTDTKTFSDAELSKPRWGISAISIGTKVFFAGGRSETGTSSRVDIFDISNNSWSQRELSVSGDFVSTVVNNKVWFVALGAKQIDIYDAATDSWSIKVMDFYIYNYDFIVKYNHAAITLNNKIYFTGKQLVQVYDIASDTWSSITLSENKVFVPAGISNNKIAFIGGMTSWFMYSKVIEIYDPATNSWSTQYMSSDLFYESIISYDNYIYSAGGLADEENINVTSICRFQL